jgi:hypothetical protein
MISIDFNKEFETLPDEPKEATPTILKSVVAFALARTENARDAVKIWDWAMQVSHSGILEMDANDRKVLRDLISESKVLMVAGKAQILKAIDATEVKQ